MRSRRTPSETPELPSVDRGTTLLETSSCSPTVPLQALAVDRTLRTGGTALWIGTGRHCVTDSLAELAPGRRILDRVEVARGFTAYQHTRLLREVGERASDETALVVVPDVDARYRGDLKGADGDRMLAGALASVARIAREHEVPVLCTRTRADEFAAPVDAAATRTIEYETTRMGPRFVSDATETLVYQSVDGWVQTTLAFWADVLEARRPVHAAGSTEGVTAGGAD